MIAPAGHSAVDALITEEPEFVLRWTVKEFHHLAQANILDPDKRTELIAGQILLIAAKVALLAFPEITVQLSDILPPKS